MKLFLYSLALKIGAALILIGSILHPAPAMAPIPLSPASQSPAALGTAIPKVIAVFTTSLQSAISSSDTSMTLVSGTDKAGNAISGYICFNIDEGSVSEEFVCGTASSTSVTAMLRGLDPVNGSLTVASLKKAHRRGATVKITNYPVDGILARILNGDDQAPNVLQYATSVTNAAITANGQNIVDYSLLASTSFSGTVAASPATGIAGIGIFSTQAQLSAGTPTSSYLGTTYSLFPWNKYFNATSSATTTVPVTNSSGKLSQGFLDLTQAFTFSGGVTSSATSTFSGNSIFSLLGTKGVLIGGGGASATTTTVAPGTSGNVLKSDGTNWTSGSLSHTTSTGSVGLPGNATTNVLTISSATSTLIINCGADQGTNNATVTFTLKANGVTLDSCNIGFGTGYPESCALNGIVGGTSSTTVAIQNSQANGGTGRCIAYTL